MANRVIPLNKNIVEAEFVTATSRYADSQLVYWGALNKITMKTYKVKARVPNSQDRYMVIRPGYEYRPDKVSKEVYGIPDFWWKIMEFNKMKDIMDFKAGTNIVIPADVLF